MTNPPPAASPSRIRFQAALALFWLVVGVFYVWAAFEQKSRFNLSAAAGGQYPYLLYAQGMAVEGVTHYFGDRNRMPLYPALLSLVHDRDWDVFVERSAWFAIGSSMLILIGVGIAAYALLPPLFAAAFMLFTAFCVFLPRASFVQAELLYYGLFFSAWLLLCRLLRQPDPRWGALTALVLGLAFLTKASTLPLIAAFLATMVVHWLSLFVNRRRHGFTDNSPFPARQGAGNAIDPCLPAAHAGKPPSTRYTRRMALALGAATLVFVVLIYPYIHGSKSRFGRFFYNVNSTFFLWCDSWQEAKKFADDYRISEHYPPCPPERIPSPGNYWRTHSGSQLWARFQYGMASLASLAGQSPGFKYIAGTAVACAWIAVRRRHRWREITVETRLCVLFTALLLIGYLTIYAWYAQIAFGDRFLLSLYLPVMVALLWCGQRLSTHSPPLQAERPPLRAIGGWCVLMIFGVLVEGSVRSLATTQTADPSFVLFYYNESRELEQAGNLAEAEKGYRGAIRLDPAFAPAYHSLGMIALTADRLDESLTLLSKAVDLDPAKADVHNSFGSALARAGRLEKSVGEFRQTVLLDPTHVSAWYNLGGSLCLLGRFDEAERVRERLTGLDPALAKRLAALIPR